MQNTISGRDAQRLVSEEQAQIVDVRSPAEYQQGAVPGAINVPIQIIVKCAEILDKQRPVLVYCASGMRSEQARQTLIRLGFKSVYNVISRENYLNG
jgi:rhodanese-related sulfurtransferase